MLSIILPNPIPTLLIPDKDADSLCATQIVYRTLLDLSFPACHLHVHFLSKGSNVFSLKERKIIEEEYVKKRGVRKVILVDMGSRGFTGPLFGSNPVEVLVVDHHWSQGRLPEGAIVLSSASSPPIVTFSTLAYILCISFLKSQSSSSTAASFVHSTMVTSVQSRLIFIYV
ncbi:hypothetical protein C8Q75DRAFT_811891 [Abortiporus biennis]|nr:hypothetical protein C8Q75DRAFT_811891 [Abortiporus biennis]